MMRQGLQECVAVSAVPGKAYEVARPLIEGFDDLKVDPSQVLQSFTALQNARFEKNATVVGSLVYFPNGERLRVPFNTYLATAAGYMLTIEDAMRARMRLVGCADEQCRARERATLDTSTQRLDDAIGPLNDAYEDTIRAMKDDIATLERQHENFE